MTKEYTEEYEINLIGFVWELLFRWKPMLVVAGLVAVMLVGYKYYNAATTITTATTATTVSEYAEMENNLSSLMPKNEVDSVNYLVSSAQMLNEQKEYLEKSVLMNVDPFNVRFLTMDFYVKSEENPVCVVADYINYIKSDVFEDVLAEALGDGSFDNYGELMVASVNTRDGISSKYNVFSFSELYSYKNDDLDDIYFDGIELKLRIPDGCDVEMIVDILSKDILERKNNNSETDYEIKFADYYLTTSFDSGLWQTQYTILSYYKSSLDEFKKEIGNLDGDKALLLEYALKARGIASIAGYEDVDDKQVQNSSISESVNKPSISIKYVVIGFIIGMFIYSGFFLMMSILFPKISYVTGGCLLESFPTLGLLDSGIKKNAFVFSPFMIKLHNRKRPNREAQIKNVVSALDYYVDEKSQPISFLFLGEENDVIKTLYNRIEDVSTLDSILMFLPTDPSKENALFGSLEKVKGKVVILIEYNKTPLKNVSTLIRLLDDKEIKVLGSIGID